MFGRSSQTRRPAHDIETCPSQLRGPPPPQISGRCPPAANLTWWRRAKALLAPVHLQLFTLTDKSRASKPLRLFRATTSKKKKKKGGRHADGEEPQTLKERRECV